MMSTDDPRFEGINRKDLWRLIDHLVEDYDDLWDLINEMLSGGYAGDVARPDVEWAELFRFEVPGDPRGKGRPRFSRAMGRAYTDSATRHYEDRVACAARGAWGGPPIDRNTPVKVTLVATFKRPGNRYRIKDEGQDQKTTKPDLDNVTKAALDALDLAGIIADQQVIEVHSRKQLAPIVDRKAKICGPTGLLVVVEVAP